MRLFRTPSRTEINWKRREEAAALLDGLIDEQTGQQIAENDRLRQELLKRDRQIRELTSERDALKRLLAAPAASDDGQEG